MNKKFLTLNDKLLSWLILPANIALFTMMMITITDIVGRSLFDAPVLGSVEVTQISLAVMIVCAFPLAVHDESHISVDLLDNVFPRWLVPWRQIVIHIIAAIALSLLTWQLYKYANRAFRYGDVTEFLRFPRGYVYAVMALMGGVSVLSSLLRMLSYVGEILDKDKAANRPHIEVLQTQHSNNTPNDKGRGK